MLNVETPLRDRRASSRRCARGHGTPVLLRRARHRQDRAGRAHCQARWTAAADDQAGQRPDEQVRRRDRAEHGAPCSARPRPRRPCCCWTRPTASCRTAACAQRTYEVTEVNEMLQGMERFNGIFICTTNLLDRIDQAALRRFTFKIPSRRARRRFRARRVPRPARGRAPRQARGAPAPRHRFRAAGALRGGARPPRRLPTMAA
jgi:SpoVK/Ycf46/Vps4 family AAA+-type ATPase